MEVHYYSRMLMHLSLVEEEMVPWEQEIGHFDTPILFGVQLSMPESDYTIFHCIHEHQHQRTQ